MKRLFSEIERSFFENLDIKALSKKEYGWALTQFKKWIVYEGKDINQLKRADILAYKAYLERSKKSESTMDFYLLVVRRFYQFVEDSGEGDNIALGIRYKRKHKGFYKEHLTDDEVVALLSSIDRSKLIGLRDYAIIYLMLCTGLRCVEISRLAVGDVHPDERYQYLEIQRKGETRKTTSFGVTAEILQPILDYFDARGVGSEDFPAFCTHGKTGEREMTPLLVGRMIRDRMKAAGVYSTKKTAHSLRHTAAVRAIKAKVPIREVQVMLGHKNVSTTEVYLRSLDDEMRLVNPAVRAISVIALDSTADGKNGTIRDKKQQRGY